MKTSAASLGLGIILGVTASAVVPVRSLAASDLLSPFRIEAEGKPIETEGGNATAFFMDVDGDGVRDLLVGQFHDGKMRIFRNTGINSAPKFAAGVWFKAGSADAKVPAG